MHKCKYEKISAPKFKRENPDIYENILTTYAPIFDIWVAVQLYLHNEPPPVCIVCGERTAVAAKNIDNPIHRRCHYEANRLTYEDAVASIPDLVSKPWEGRAKKSTMIKRHCEIHGEYDQVMSSALTGIGCQKCHFDRLTDTPKVARNVWFKRFEEVHGDTYDYSKLPAKLLSDKKVTIICKKHGEFLQAPIVHKNGHGCPLCGVNTISVKLSHTADSYIDACKKIHGDTYSYEKTNYTGVRDVVTITCKKHGDFEQVAYYHTAGNGCQTCGLESAGSRSSYEYEIIEFIKSLGDFEIIHSNRSFKFELDIYLPNEKFAIEFDGLYWHSYPPSLMNEYKNKHLNKTEVCEENGVHLFHIFENEWINHKDLWKSMIRNKLGKSKRLYARKCTVSNVSISESRAFCESNHMQGYRGKYNYGLYHCGELVSLITVGKPRYDKCSDLEIIRFCTLKNHTVVGGFSKLLKHISKHHSGTLVSYANRRWSGGNLYEQAGFTLQRKTGPCQYFWNGGYKLYHRSSFWKDNINSVIDEYDESLTAMENAENNKFKVIWDCGNLTYTRSI